MRASGFPSDGCMIDLVLGHKKSFSPILEAKFRVTTLVPMNLTVHCLKSTLHLQDTFVLYRVQDAKA